MSSWQPAPRTRRIVTLSVWTFVAGMPVLACFYPALWEDYFLFLITGLLATLPFWRGHLFRLKDEQAPAGTPDPAGDGTRTATRPSDGQAGP